MDEKLKKVLVEEILRARERIYRINRPTPIELIEIESIEAEIYLKREDLSSINSYKWRGAYNSISMLSEEDRKKPIIAASAGNHAQGVAMAARLLGLTSRIYMPRSTPQMKQVAVDRHGKGTSEIILVGDTYNEAAEAALIEAEKTGSAFIHPFDNLYTIAGQATIADEIVLSGKGPFDYAFIQIGGGGLAAGISTWLRIHYPDIKIIGVEGEEQASMKASIDAGKIVTLESVDTFCDGTAVNRPGEICFDICKDTLDSIITVSNAEVCAAIETTWEHCRFIPEPSGAMGLAGVIKYARENPEDIKGKKIVTPICGANMDFSKLRVISANAAVGAHRQKFLRFSINEQSGSLLDLIQKHLPDINITAFQYGKVSNNDAFPVVAFEASPEDLDAALKSLNDNNVPYEDITDKEDTRYRIINYTPSLFSNPAFMNVHFSERCGALREFLDSISDISNICYFNYVYTGETIGRAIMGFEFEDEKQKESFMNCANSSSVTCKPIDPDTLERILYKA